PARLDPAVLRARAADATLRPVLRDLVPARARRAISPVHASSLSGQLSGLSEADGLALLLGLVQTHAGAVLGHDPSDAAGTARTIAGRRPFRDAGFDSLTAV